MTSNIALEPLRPVQVPGNGYDADSGYHSQDYKSQCPAQDYAGNDDARSTPYDNRSIAEQSLLNPNAASKSKSKSPKGGVPHWIRIVLRVLSLLLSLTIIGIIVNVLIIYKNHWKANWKYGHGHRLNSWPRPMNWVPTNFMLAAASLVTIFNLIALASLCGCFKKIKLSKFGRFTSILSSLIAVIAWIAAVAYYKAYDTKMKTRYDMWSWTCSHKYIKLKEGNKTIGLDFICLQMAYAFYAGIAIAVLELIGLILLAFNMRANGRAMAASGRNPGKYSQLDS